MDQSAYILGGLDNRVSALEREQERIGSEVKTIRAQIELVRAWGLRVLILLGLWIAALGSHLTREQSSEVLAAVVKALIAALK